MLTASAPELLHIVGYLTGGLLYAMLLAMAARRDSTGDRLTVGTALLGLTWNLGELATHVLDTLGQPFARNWLTAVSYGALGLLAAVVVHSAGRGRAGDGRAHHSWARAIPTAAYACAGVAAAMQLFAAMSSRPLPWSAALVVLTLGLAALAAALVVTTRRQPHSRRAIWMVALALFTVSALHLIGFHGTSEGWTTELLGHHASIPLAFAILYQDYRFALADLFLKRALTVLALVCLVFVTWSALAPILSERIVQGEAVTALLAAWVATTLVAPWLQRAISTFVDRIVLRRANYRRLLDELTSTVQQCDRVESVLDHACATLAPAINAHALTWRESPAAFSTGDDIVVPTAEPPHYSLRVERLEGGRRLLSDDRTMLDRAALLAARRIDALRLSDERYEQMLREREIGTLAAQAELRALRAQINPHFLFNALTTIGYLIQNAPPRAFDTLMRLTTLLRGVLRSEGEFTTLGHERELIDSYLRIERERFEERLETRLDIRDELADFPIPSLILQPLVENAIKHGIAKALHGGMVSVTAGWDHASPTRRLRITVLNTGASMAPSPSPHGIGLQNVRRRLECHFGDDARLTLKTDPDGVTRVELLLPVPDLEDSAVPVTLSQDARA
ncbi:MAG: histidine kinase [Acidobacteria bacterium]|nr:histidine kinase [Acidobacteriota bacterium]